MARLNLVIPKDGESRDDKKRKSNLISLNGLEQRLITQALSMGHLWNECVTLQFLGFVEFLDYLISYTYWIVQSTYGNTPTTKGRRKELACST